MAINTNLPPNEYTATASQTLFTFNFKIFTDTDIVVYQTPSGQTPNDTTDILTLNTHYTVTIDGDNGGTITLLTGAGVGDMITLTRELPITRNVDYQQGGDILAETSNDDQEYQTYLIQDQETANNRFITIPKSSQGINLELPAPLSDSYIKWNSSANGLENDTSIPTNVILSEQYKNEALAAKLAAETAQSNTEQILDNFDDRYLGSKTSDPTLDNDGNSLLDGALYFNTSSNEMKVYDLGTTTWLTIPQIYLSALQDVQFTSITTGNILQWNGTKWINTTIEDVLNLTLLAEKTTPVNNDIFVIEDSENSFNKKKLTFQNLKNAVSSQLPSVTGTLTATNSTNNINLTGVGALSSLEIGDVIQISGSLSNNSEYTIEVITDANNIIVNQAHAGGSTTKSLISETNTANVTIKLLSKWYNSPKGLGQGWVNVISSRIQNTTYPNLTNRTISVGITANTQSSMSVNLFIDGLEVFQLGDNTETSTVSVLSTDVPPNSNYLFDSPTFIKWYELR